MLDGPVFIQLHCLNGTNIRSRAVRYSDPADAGTYGGGAFQFEDADGSKTYVPWGAILQLVVFDLSHGQTPPEVPAQTEVTS